MQTRTMKSVFAVVLIFVVSSSAFSQKTVINDTNYYERFPDHLTTRIYLQQKFQKFTIPSKSMEDVEYKANTKMNLGMGVTYRNISLNVFYGFAFLNKDTVKGETKGLDLQFHLYPRRWAIDLIALFPKGYYLFPKGYATTANRYYYRPDVHMRLVGVSAYQVPNKQRFSYRAAITQNEWQKKSAGSPLYGGMIYNGAVSGDSALVPKAIESAFAQKGIRNVNFTGIGAGLGYAYTLVIKKHFFVTASAVGNLDLTITSEDGIQGKHRKTTVGPALVAKAALGYNSSTWNVSINSLGSAFWSKGDFSSQQYYLPCGAIRLVVSRKFSLKHHS